MDLAALEAEEARLIFPAFDETTALALGEALVALARETNLPVVINIRDAGRTYFHAALPGSAGLNDLWARRKSATALLFGQASLKVGERNRQRGQTLASDGLDWHDYADHGGAVPIRVKGVGVVAVVTVSGLPERDDHALAVRAIERMLARPVPH